MDELMPKEKVAYQIMEDGVSWWVTGLVAAVKNDDTVDIYPESIHFETFQDQYPVNVHRNCIVPTKNFTLWTSRRFWYFGGPRGRQASSVMWMERVVDVKGNCSTIESKDILIIGGTMWMVLGFFRLSGGEARIALLKEPHTLDYQERESVILQRVCQTQCAGLLIKFERVPKFSSAGLSIFEKLDIEHQKIVTRIFDSIINEIYNHVCKKNKTLFNYGDVLKKKHRFVNLPNSISLSSIMSKTSLDSSEPVVVSAETPKKKPVTPGPVTSPIKPRPTSTSSQSQSKETTATKKASMEPKTVPKLKLTISKKIAKVPIVADSFSDDDDDAQPVTRTSNKRKSPNHPTEAVVSSVVHQQMIVNYAEGQRLLKSTIQDNKSQINDLRDQIKDLKKERNDATSLAEDRGRQMVRLEQIKAQLESTVSQNRSEIAVLETNSAEIATRLLEANEKASKLEAELVQSNQKLEEVQNQLQSILAIRLNKEELQQTLQTVLKEELRVVVAETSGLVTPLINLLTSANRGRPSMSMDTETSPQAQVSMNRLQNFILI